MKKILLWLLCAGMVTGCQLTHSRHSKFDIRPGTRVAFLAGIHFQDRYAQSGESRNDELPTQTPDGEQKALISSMARQLKSGRLHNEGYFALAAALDEIASRGIKLVALPGNSYVDQPRHRQGLARLLREYRDRHNMRFFVIPNHHKTHIANNALNAQNPMNHFGLLPQPGDLLHETPFTWCKQNAPAQCITLPDNSYLTEPVPGVWILAIDASVNLPADSNSPTSNNTSGITGSLSGYNAVLQYKPQLLDWVASVVKRANAQHKELVAFSQAPAIDVYNGATQKTEQLFGKTEPHMRSLPSAQTAQVLADTGLKLHVGAGMHMNGTGAITGKRGNALFNIQVPSLTAYRPAYKILTLNKHAVYIETQVLDNVPRFNELFDHYRREHAYLTAHQPDTVWDSAILNARNYGELTQNLLLARIQQHYLPNIWPADLTELLTNTSIGNLISNVDSVCKQLQTVKRIKNGSPAANASEVNPDPFNPDFYNPVAPLPAITLVNDFYRLRYAGSIAHIDGVRKNCYVGLSKELQQCGFVNGSSEHKLSLMMAVMEDFITAEPGKNTRINLQTGQIDVMSVSRKRVPLNPYFLDLEAQPAQQFAD